MKKADGNRLHPDFQINEMRRGYEDGKLSVEQLCKTFGISSSTLYRHIKSGNWQKRRDRQRQSQSDAGLIADESRPLLGELQRLRHICTRYIASLEAEIDQAPHEEQTPADRERNVRALRNVLKMVEDIARLEEQLQNQQSTTKETAFDENIRLELARRIDALRSHNR